MKKKMVSDDTFLDFLLMKSRCKTIACATMKKKKAIEEEINLDKRNSKIRKKITEVKEIL